MRHLFLTLHEVAFGEALLGVRLAEEHVAAGDEVVYLAPGALAAPLRGAPVRYGKIDHALERFDSVLPDLVDEIRPDAVCLVDAQATFASFQHRGFDCGRLLRLPAPVVALDVWDLTASGLVVDYGPSDFTVDARVLEVPRIVPVPFARPTAAGAYRALPQPIDRAAARARGRARLGVTDADRVVLFPTAAWQHREAALPLTRPSAEAVPPILDAYVKRLGVKLVHIGPWRLPGVDALHLPQVPRDEFADLVAAADLLLSLNAAASTIGTALVAGTPVLLLHHDAPARGLHPFRAWPCGLGKLLGAALADNPFTDAIPSVELLDEEAVHAAAAAILADPAPARARTAAYVDEIARLPSGRERYLTAVRRAGTG